MPKVTAMSGRALAEVGDQRCGGVLARVQVQGGVAFGKGGEQGLESVARASGEPDVEVAGDS